MSKQCSFQVRVSGAALLLHNLDDLLSLLQLWTFTEKHIWVLHHGNDWKHISRSTSERFKGRSCWETVQCCRITAIQQRRVEWETFKFDKQKQRIKEGTNTFFYTSGHLPDLNSPRFFFSRSLNAARMSRLSSNSSALSNLKKKHTIFQSKGFTWMKSIHY